MKMRTKSMAFTALGTLVLLGACGSPEAPATPAGEEEAMAEAQARSGPGGHDSGRHRALHVAVHGTEFQNRQGR
jgi:hypothetical protein